MTNPHEPYHFFYQTVFAERKSSESGAYRVRVTMSGEDGTVDFWANTKADACNMASDIFKKGIGLAPYGDEETENMSAYYYEREAIVSISIVCRGEEK